MKSAEIRVVSFRPGLSFNSVSSFKQAFPHLTPAEIDHYSKTMVNSNEKASKVTPKKEEDTGANEVKKD